MNATSAESPPPAKPPLWQIVPTADYERPTDSQPATLQRRWRALGRLLLGDDKGEAAPARAEADLRALPQLRLANLVPPIDWAPAARALGAPDEDTHAPVRLFIGQPYCDHAATLAHWACTHDAVVLTPPDSAQILAADQRWLDDLAPAKGHPWVLPELERCFLRHASGLELLRGFLARALSGALGPGLIGCDSWALAFIERIWPLPGTPRLTLQAFDGPALTRYLMQANRGHVRFLSARSGKPLLPERPADGKADATAAEESTCPELRQLAAHCRGNPGLAWHYWRQRLRAAPEHQPQEQADGSPSQPATPARTASALPPPTRSSGSRPASKHPRSPPNPARTWPSCSMPCCSTVASMPKPSAPCCPSPTHACTRTCCGCGRSRCSNTTVHAGRWRRSPTPRCANSCAVAAT